ncbi:hypothetical protein PVN28_14940 [Bacillus licheniformis]|uniref:hypothetical protein n=1 Tax=Bacillus licheniformis TaxID=1402 RepID=UPI00047C0F72|nr:hypothetical protein [Bacillus licheniformis]MCM3436817.1 hypothetical protein [Bacillus licheniformis]MDE1440948.1 hypothetical protein [Bacillus licheniformis]
MKLGDKVTVKAIYKKHPDSSINFHELLKDIDTTEIINQQVLKRVEMRFDGIVCGKRRRAVERMWEYGWLDELVYGGSDVGFTVVDVEPEKGQMIIDTVCEPFYLVAKNLTGFYLVKAEDMEVSDESQ